MSKSRVRIETGPTPLFTRVFVDDVELRGVTRVWFDTGDFNAHDGPVSRRSWNEPSRVHIDLIPDELRFEGTAEVTANDVRPKVPV